MFRLHILTKVVERSNLFEISQLLLVNKEVSENFSEILKGYLFNKIELQHNDDERELKYVMKKDKVRVEDYNRVIIKELESRVNKIKINPEDINELKVLSPNEVKKYVSFTPIDKYWYLRVQFNDKLMIFLLLLIKKLKTKKEFTVRTHYLGSYVYFEFLYWYKFEEGKRESFRIS